MSEDQFTRLFKYMQNGFDRLDEKLDKKASHDSIDLLTNTIDSLLISYTKIQPKKDTMQYKVPNINKKLTFYKIVIQVIFFVILQ